MALEPVKWAKDRICAEPRGHNTAKVLHPALIEGFDDEPDYTDGRVIIEGIKHAPDDWAVVTDKLTGLMVRVRRAACGGGCRCSAEVELV